MESILKSIKTKKIPINPAVVISNNSDAKGLKIAKKLGVNIEVIESKNFKGNRTEYDKKIMNTLANYGVTPKNGLVCLAGFMKIISPGFVKKYKNRIINYSSSIITSISRIEFTKTSIRSWCKIFWMYSTFCRFRYGHRSNNNSSSCRN